LGLLALSATRSASATSGAAFGIGPRTLALANAGATLGTGYEAAFENPAQLAQEFGHQALEIHAPLKGITGGSSSQTRAILYA